METEIELVEEDKIPRNGIRVLEVVNWISNNLPTEIEARIWKDGFVPPVALEVLDKTRYFSVEFKWKLGYESGYVDVDIRFDEEDEYLPEPKVVKDEFGNLWAEMALKSKVRIGFLSGDYLGIQEHYAKVGRVLEFVRALEAKFGGGKAFRLYRTAKEADEEEQKQREFNARKEQNVIQMKLTQEIEKNNKHMRVGTGRRVSIAGVPPGDYEVKIAGSGGQKVYKVVVSEGHMAGEQMMSFTRTI